jgi:hypothetical protein
MPGTMVEQGLMLLRNTAGPRCFYRAVMCALAACVLSGCGGGSMFGLSSSGDGPSLGSRFSQIFGSNSQAVGETPSAARADTELACPPVSIRSGASTLAVGLPGKPASGNDLRYQVTITRTARDCNLNSGQVAARLGIEGRVIVGPAGAPPSIDIPLRVAVVQEGIQDKIVFTKFYTTSVAVSGDNTAYSFVAEDLIYPVPQGAAGDSYIFYIGFDPNGLKPPPVSRPAKRARPQG